MGYYYIKKENIVSVGQVAGAITVPVQKGVNKLGSIFFNFDQERLSKEEALAKIESLEDENKENTAKLEMCIRDRCISS